MMLLQRELTLRKSREAGATEGNTKAKSGKRKAETT